MKKSKTQEDLELLEQGVIPESMEWRLPESGYIFFDPEKVNYNLNNPAFWYSKWDEALLEQFPCLQMFITKPENVTKTPLDEILEKQKKNNDIIYEDGIQLSLNKETEILDTLYSS